MSGSSLVEVTFVDAGTGEEFLRLKFPARQLPDSFGAQTTMHLGKDDWLVVEASPPTALEFVASGALKLRMRKLEQVDPSKLLFSLPTVADEIPQPVEAPSAPEPLLRLPEDDWLQLELLPREAEAAARRELSAIQQILDHERSGEGFKKLHLRKALAHPFAARPLSFEELCAAAGDPPERPIAWAQGSGVLEGGFALCLPSGLVLYGQRSPAGVTGLGVAPKPPREPSRAAGELSHLMASLGLLLADWCRARLVDDPAGFFEPGG
ncbi:MAG: hypothetical protein ACYC8T_28500 [Myxococcaceae bacterium]